MIKLNRTEKIATFCVLAVVTLLSSLVVSQRFFKPSPTIDHSLTISTSSEGTTDPAPGVYSHVEGSIAMRARDPQVIRDNQWPYTVDVLRVAKESSCKTALATLSKRKDVMYVVKALDIKEFLDVIVTAEDVIKGKPDPEIYLLVAQKLGLPQKECLVLEDSVNGVKSALAADMSVVAIATPFTKASILSSRIIDDEWIVQEPNRVAEVVKRRIEEHNSRAPI